nr:hypothetical protein [Tanacetum cinerariifolium]
MIYVRVLCTGVLRSGNDVETVYVRIFKDFHLRIGRGTALRTGEVIVQNTTSTLSIGALIPTKSDYQREVERRDEWILAAKEKKRAQKPQDKAVGKRPGRAGTSGRTKKRKIIPLSIALPESEADGSLEDGSGVTTMT